MARKTLQKRVSTTTVHGYIIQGGAPVEAAFELQKKCELNTAQAIVRKTNPSFAATAVTENTALYQMTLDDFIKHATIVDTNEQEG